METESEEFNAWNPGLTSDIPVHLYPKITLFDPANSQVNYEQAKNFAEFCGLKPYEMNAFNVSRLIVHETFVRVTSDLYVQDGPNYEDLGISMRGMTDTIIRKYITPNLSQLEAEVELLRSDVFARLNQIYESELCIQPRISKPSKKGFFAKIFNKENKPRESKSNNEFDTLNKWQNDIHSIECPIQKACINGMHRIIGAIVGHRGRLTGDKELIVQMVTNWVCNDLGSRKIGELIEPMIRHAAEQEGYKFLPAQEKPVILNVKGASAAGKSTLRQFQKKLVDRLDIKWEDFALISPDYWRKYLLDYDSIGKDFKYAAMLTGHELQVIDRKLDLYVESKANQKKLPHLLIDRFRFDSFALGMNNQPSKRMLSRFGHTVFLFFVITPPTETVPRAWNRGHTTGRYKSVDDLLYHNVEAYTGIPKMFLKWVKNKHQKVHFEFLDNNVANGDIPKTVAFGWNDRLIVLNPELMRIFHQYRSINLKAERPEDVYLDVKDSDEDFLTECIEKISEVTFIDSQTEKIVGQTNDGKYTFEFENFFSKNRFNPQNRRPKEKEYNANETNENFLGNKSNFDFELERRFTLGKWGVN